MDNEFTGWSYPKLLSVCIHNTGSGTELSFKLKDIWLNLTLGRDSFDEAVEQVVCSMKFWMLYPWRCSRSGWTGLQTISSSEGNFCLCQLSWGRWSLNIPSTPNHLMTPWFTSNTLPNAAQEVSDLHCCHSTLLNCTEPAVHKDSLDNFYKLAFVLSLHRAFLPRGKILHSTYADLHEVSASPFLQPVPPDNSTALWCISHSLWCYFLCRLHESALIMKSSSSTDPWGTSYNWPPDGFCAANVPSSSSTFQGISPFIHLVLISYII